MTFLVYVVCIVCTLIMKIYCIEIWKDNMENEDNWDETGSVRQYSATTECDINLSRPYLCGCWIGGCLQVRNNNNNGISWIRLKNAVDVSLYENIVIRYSVSSCGSSGYDGNEWCEAWIQYDSDNTWYSIGQWGDLQTNFPRYTSYSNVDDTANTIKLEFESISSNEACCVDEVSIEGDLSPTITPTSIPTISPIVPPTLSPTMFPTGFPTNTPSETPTKPATYFPTNYPTKTPTNQSTDEITVLPSKFPSNQPTIYPTKYPTKHPTRNPSESPSIFPVNSDINPVKSGSNGDKISNEDMRNEAMGVIIFILVFLILCVITAMILYCVIKREKRLRQQVKEMKAYQTQTQGRDIDSKPIIKDSFGSEGKDKQKKHKFKKGNRKHAVSDVEELYDDPPYSRTTIGSTTKGDDSV